MKKAITATFLVLFVITLQACSQVTKEAATLDKSEQWAKKDPNGFVEKGYIGINVKLNSDNEIEIISIADDSPAQKEDIKRGDIVLEIDGVSIKDKYQAFKIYDAKYPGDSVTAILRRHGKVLTKKLENLPAFHTPTVIYNLTERIYKGLPVRLVIIPEKLSIYPPALDSALTPNMKDYHLKIKRAFEGMFLKAFNGHDNFVIVDRENIAKILEEIKLQLTGLVSYESQVKIGQMLGATHLMLMQQSYNLKNSGELVYTLSIDIIEVEGNRKIATTAFNETFVMEKDAIEYIRNSELRNDIIAYDSSWRGKVTDSEQEGRKAYLGVVGNNYTNDDSLIRAFKQTVIPKYAEHLAALKEIRPTTEEVSFIHNQYIDVYTLQYEAFCGMLEALEINDERKFTDYNNKIVEAKEMMSRTKKKYDELLNKAKLKSK
jgi:hypothetical protein